MIQHDNEGDLDGPPPTGVWVRTSTGTVLVPTGTDPQGLDGVCRAADRLAAAEADFTRACLAARQLGASDRSIAGAAQDGAGGRHTSTGLTYPAIGARLRRAEDHRP